MIEKEFLDLLCCPESRSPLHLADDRLILRINEAIAGRRLKNRAGEPVESPLSGGLVPEEGNVLYPIIDGLPIMLVDEAIPLAQFEGE